MPNRKGTETVSQMERDAVKCTDKDCAKTVTRKTSEE